VSKKLLILGALIAFVAYVYFSGLYSYLNEDTVRRLLTESGIWGPFLFIGLYVLGELVNIPSVLWIIVAGLTWPPVQAFVIAWVASVIAAVVVFVFYRYIARDVVQGRLPDRMKDLDSRLESGGLWAVAGIRLVAFLAPWTHPALAVSSVSLRDYVLGTALGVVPGVLLLVLFGGNITGWITSLPAWVWVVAVVVIAATLVIYRLASRSRETG